MLERLLVEVIGESRLVRDLEKQDGQVEVVDGRV